MKLVTLKTISGEDVFAEILDANEHHLHLLNPLIVDSFMNEEGLPTMTARKYLQNCSIELVPFSNHAIVSMGDIDEEGRKFYGMALLQIKISQIKRDAMLNMMGAPENDYHVILDAVNMIKDTSNIFAEKYHIPPADTEDMEKLLEEQKPIVH